MGITLDQIVFDPSAAEGATVGSHILAGDDGTAIGHVGDALKVDIGSVTDLDIRDLSHTQDSVKVGDGTDFLAVNTDGSVNITDNGGSITVDGSVTVSATDLDIRDLSATQDNVAISDGTDTLAVNADGSLNAIVTATNLDIRDLTHVSDSVKVGDGTDLLAINADGSVNITDNGGSITVDGSVTVSSTDLDIRDLDHSQDNVSIAQGGNTAIVDASGRLAVLADIDLTGDLVGDDEPDTEDPLKVGSRAVNGALTAISTSGNKANLISDMYRRAYVNNAPNIAAKASASTVGTSAAQLAASPLLGRMRILVQNLSSKDIYIGHDNTVTTATGIMIPAKSSMDIPCGEDVVLYAISGTAGNNVRLLELA
jgi:hypothetical protein